MIEIKKPINTKNNTKADNDILFEALNKTDEVDDLFEKKEKKVTISVSIDKKLYEVLTKFMKKNNLKRGLSRVVQKAIENLLTKYEGNK